VKAIVFVSPVLSGPGTFTFKGHSFSEDYMSLFNDVPGWFIQTTAEAAKNIF
jgi:hypothetical protein